MTRKGVLLTLLALALLAFLPAGIAQAGVPFRSVSLTFEEHPQHGDGMAIVTVETYGEGLARLEVYAPGGRNILTYESKNKRNLGGRVLRLETPEPEFANLLISYPEGLYKFIGVTYDGQVVEGFWALKHVCLNAPRLIPQNDLPTLVPTPGRVIAWEAVEGAMGYEVRVYEPKTGAELHVKLAKNQTRFTIPAGWLLPNLEYSLSVGVFSETGNVTFTHDKFVPIGW